MGRNAYCDSVRKTGRVLVSVKFLNGVNTNGACIVNSYLEKESVFQTHGNSQVDCRG